MRKLSISLLTICFLTVGHASRAANIPKKGEISMEKAQEIATKQVSGKIKSSEYEFEKGQNVYSFDILAKDGSLHELLVSARTGKIVSSTIESAAKEAAEAKADQKKKQD
jgi:uncharacterized membrane protein YkoI